MKLVAVFLVVFLIKGSIQNTPAPPYECNDSLDVVLVADRSQSITVANSFRAIQDAVIAFSDEIAQNNPNIRLGVVFYDGTVNTLSLTTSTTQVRNFVNSQVAGAATPTFTNLGIDAAISMLDGRITRNTANIVVLTDGISTTPDQTRISVQNAIQKGYSTFAVGVNVQQPFDAELSVIAQSPSRLFVVNELPLLSETMRGLARTLCAYTVCSGCNVDIGSRRAAHPLRCDKFYMCEKRTNQDGVSELVAFEKNCPVKSVWHRQKLTCVSEGALMREALAECGYCDGNRQSYRALDSCELYYTCGLDDNQDPLLNANCCPLGQSYNFAAEQCQIGACTARQYGDARSCRGYFYCNATTTQWNSGCCPAGQRFNETAQICENYGDCLGSCTDATDRGCSDKRPDPNSQCNFFVVVSNASIPMTCPYETGWSQTECRCVHNANCARPTVAKTCEPSVRVDEVIPNFQRWGFESFVSKESRWVDDFDVDCSSAACVFNGRGGFLLLPYYSNNDQAFTDNTLLLQLNVKDDLVNNNFISRQMVLLANTPCPGTQSEAGTEPSILITENPSTGVTSFSVRTAQGRAQTDVTLNRISQDSWNEVTMRYSQRSGTNSAGQVFGRLEGCVTEYAVVPTGTGGRVRNILQQQCSESTETSGKILTSECGMILGRDIYTNYFQGSMTRMVFYDGCEPDAPDVPAVNQNNIGNFAV